MRVFALIFAALFALDAVARCTSENSAVEFVQDFYAKGHYPSIVPTEAELESRRHLFSERLRRLFEDAAKYREDWIARHPSEPSVHGGPAIIYKPPFADGDIFTGSQDGATGFTVSAATRGASGTWRVLVESKAEPRMSTWAVEVAVADEQDHCVIDDVVYLPATADPDADRLSSYLRYRSVH